MSSPQAIPGRNRPTGDMMPPSMSPVGSPSSHHHFLIPNPMPTKRTRTYSASERALAQPTLTGRVKTFCREKGHGFIIPKSGGEPIFVHISDIDGDFVPKANDEVSYKAFSIPPKNDKISAVHVNIIHPAEGVQHETWEEALEQQPHHR